MAHFAELDVFKKVIKVLVVNDKDTQDNNGNEVSSIGTTYLHDLLGGTWLRTSRNTLAGSHLLGKTPFRKNYAGIGYSYDQDRDAFVPPKPYPSWVLNEETCQWDAPTAEPDDGKRYEWDEPNTQWTEI